MARKASKDAELERQSATDLITLLLQERWRRIDAGTLSGINERHIYYVLSHALIWCFSEAGGHKYEGCRFWSEGALRSLRKHGKVVTNRKEVGGDALRHEHLFPRKQLIAKLFSVVDLSTAEVRTILDQFNIAVIVSHDEDVRLSREGDESDPWERYRRAAVSWRDVNDDGGLRSSMDAVSG